MGGIIFTLAAYIVFLAFIGGVLGRLIIYSEGLRRDKAVRPARRSGFLSRVFPLFSELFLLKRLMKANPLLWVGEWLFHVSFILVLLRHLRYFMEPAPAWLFDFEVPGIIAGFLLFSSLLFILAAKLFSEKAYMSSYNFSLLAMLIVISATGLLMTMLIKTDLVDIKFFSMGMVTFAPQAFPSSGLFLAHFSVFLFFVFFLPSHIFTAPITILEAVKRDEELETIMHDEKK